MRRIRPPGSTRPVLEARPIAASPIRLSTDIPVREILAWFVRWKVALAIAAGIAFRLACLLDRRGFWLDEGSLIGNIHTLNPVQFFGPLINQQLAAPGFLIGLWCSNQILGETDLAMRLIPFLGGIAGLFLFLGVARRCLSPEAIFGAVVLFASANDLIYYASEVKQYSTDVAATLACLLIGLTVASRPLTVASSASLAAFGAAIVWFSHPSIFVLASVGSVGLIRAIVAKDRRSMGLWLVVGIAWLGSFAGVHAVSTRQLAGSDQMWRFWGFAFPTMPPRSFRDATWPIRRLAYYFINPLNFDIPFGPRVSMLPAFGLAVLGFIRIGQRDRSQLALLVLPVVATLAASCFRLYPFHGRLVLFLAAIPLLAIAAGLDAIRQSRGRGVIYYALVVLVLVMPTAYAIEQVFEQSWIHNHLGDLHPINLAPDRFPF